MIQGMTVTLHHRIETGKDALNNPIYQWYEPETVNDVLVGEPTPEERTDELNLSGRRIAFSLGIPKGDTHEWKDQIVEFFGHKFLIFGEPKEGIEANIPLRWHKIYKCERYE